jgi:type I restriction enzyme S subunit
MKPSVNGWRTVCLSDVADIASGVAKGRRLEGEIVTVPYLRVANVQAGHLDLSEIKEIVVLASEVDKYRLLPGDILMTEGGDRDKLGRGTVWRGQLDPCIHQNHVFRVRPAADRLMPEFLNYYLQTPPARAYFLRCAKQTTGIASVNRTQLCGLPVPLPELSEQGRVAAILDKADGIRRKRRDAVALALAFRRSAFLEMFGDPALNSKHWKPIEFSYTWQSGLRNGISPSARGEYEGKVLVLSAITGPTFDHHAVKVGKFEGEFDDDQLVQADEFLICRGNGNLTLVGSGRFPHRPLTDTVFPDTMIAARINRELLEPAYLEELWATPHIRSQLERGARTTNGTHKINQQVLAGITFPLPPLSNQRRFAELVAVTSRLHDRYKSCPDDDLFDSLVQRAFRGEL